MRKLENNWDNEETRLIHALILRVMDEASDYDHVYITYDDGLVGLTLGFAAEYGEDEIADILGQRMPQVINWRRNWDNWDYWALDEDKAPEVVEYYNAVVAHKDDERFQSALYKLLCKVYKPCNPAEDNN